MNIKKIKNKIDEYIKDGCKGKVWILDETLEDRILEITDIQYMYDIVEAETEGVIIRSKIRDYDEIDVTTIDYGTILKVKDLTGKDEIDIIMLTNNMTAGDTYNCKVLDLSSKEILADFKSIIEFKEKVNIVKVVGQFDELFSI